MPEKCVVFGCSNVRSKEKGILLHPIPFYGPAWVEYINTDRARICLKELYESRYDPLSISYAVVSDICPSGWGYFNGYCYFSSRACSSWLSAELKCSAVGSSLVTIHNHEENVYVQHRNNGERSWIGLNDRSVEGSFVWTNHELSSFRFWAPRQPNNWRNEDCVHTLGAKHGYTWNDVSCDSCYNFTCFKDTDECSTNTHSCDVNAVCSNTKGSYLCTCNSGFSGDGKTCSDINECNSGLHNCSSSRATCTNTVGSYNCSCVNPYTGDGRACNHPASECRNYNTLSSYDRKINYYGSGYCDSGIGPAWFRFQGAAGTRMPTSCPPRNRCNTRSPGWLRGGHPSVADGQVSRTVCFYRYSYYYSCCGSSTTIQVRNCGSFYVYYLNSSPCCNCRYCGTS
ncbi:uromodulin-like [Montipora capricornis]|uniref:uromodulin-like n=1 Tax=Montipora capricornis TaxID=246305 RepID=UPI0035F167E7